MRKLLIPLVLLLLVSVANAQVVVPLKQSTTVTLKIGPFVDRTDMVTAETAVATVITSNTKISKNFGAFAARGDSTLPVHDSGAPGYYSLVLNTTDTNTLGPLIIAIDDAATFLPFRATYVVYPANVFDSLQSGTAKLAVNSAEVGAQALGANAGGNFNVFFNNGTAASTLTQGALDTRSANLDATISSRAPSSTALSTATWTSGKAAFLDSSIAGVQTTASSIQSILTGASSFNDLMIGAGATPTRLGKLDAPLLNVSADAADKFDSSAKGIVKGTVVSASPSGGTTVITVTGMDPPMVQTNQFSGRIMIFGESTTTADLRGQATDVISNTTSTITVTALTDPPVLGDTFTLN